LIFFNEIEEYLIHLAYIFHPQGPVQH